MKVLVLGGAGFIGSVLCPYLRERGDEVTVMDALLFEKGKKISSPSTLVRGDVRDINDLLPPLIEADAVVNLAAISNDPASELKPQLTWEVNYKANETISQLCRATGKRVVHASTCSVYGFSESEVFTERSKPGPITLYAQTKMLSEQHYLHEDLDAIVLRFATVHGYTPKPRFDLVVNTMVGNAFFNGQITVNGGEQRRPIVHVKDVAKAVYLALHVKEPKHRVYNVGADDQNYQIKTLGTLIAEEIPNVKLVHKKDNIDRRSFTVDFGLIKQDLGFNTEYTVLDTISDFYDAFNKGLIKALEEDAHYRVKYLKKLLTDDDALMRLPDRSYYLPLNVSYAHRIASEWTPAVR